MLSAFGGPGFCPLQNHYLFAFFLLLFATKFYSVFGRGEIRKRERGEREVGER